jgi:shikimate kinase
VSGHRQERREVPRRLWLIGEMGAGKSTTGRALAAALAWRYCDNDTELTRATRRTLLELEDLGAGALHGAEREVAQRFFTSAPPLIAGLPASVIDDDATAATMRSCGRAAYLQLPEAVRRARIRDTARPWLHDDPRVDAPLHARRRARFKRHADVVLDATAPVATLVASLVALASEWWPAGADRRDRRDA